MEMETQISPPSENVEGMSTLSEVASIPSQEGDPVLSILICR